MKPDNLMVNPDLTLKKIRDNKVGYSKIKEFLNYWNNKNAPKTTDENEN